MILKVLFPKTTSLCTNWLSLPLLSDTETSLPKLNIRSLTLPTWFLSFAPPLQSTSMQSFLSSDSSLMLSQEIPFPPVKDAMRLQKHSVQKYGLATKDKLLSTSSIKFQEDKLNTKNTTRDWDITGSPFQPTTMKDRFHWSIKLLREIKEKRSDWKLVQR